MKSRHILFTWLLIVSVCASAHEITTHGLLTKEAYSYSTLGSHSQTLANDLGLTDWSGDLGSTYYDGYDWNLSTETLKSRTVDSFEGHIISDVLGVSPSSIGGWLLRGAIREDDVPKPFGDNPQDDPYGQIFRVANHFFDPYNNRPLTVGFALGEKAPDWGIGVVDAFASPMAVDSNRRNHFTVFDAREALWRALTGKKNDGTTDAGINGGPTTEDDRKAYWATTFRALGDILHLNQDMSQPQHTRNEPHAATWWPATQFAGHKSFMEQYFDARAKNASEFSMNGETVNPLQDLSFLGDPNYQYPIPTFDTYSKFWSTNPGTGSVTGQGLADYSNQGFFTPAHNLDDTTYPSPRDVALTPDQTAFPDSVVGTLSVSFLDGPVRDSNTGQSDTIKLTTQSIWNVFGAVSPTYSLNHVNYDDMAKLLLPRAVAYSAGLINYFFRGRLSITSPDEGAYGIVDQEAVRSQPGQGFKTIKLKIQNITPNGEAMGDGSSQGMLVAVVKYHLNSCYNENLSDSLDVQADPSCYDTAEYIATSAPISVTNIDASKYVEYTFDFSQKPVPINALDLSLQVVYRGKLGNESDAVAVATKKISGPTFFSFFNDTDQFCYNGAWVATDTTSGASYLNSVLDFDHDKQADLPYQPRPIDINFRFVSSGPIGTVTALPAGRYSRVAVLTDVPLVPFFNIEAYTSKSVTLNPAQLYYWSGAWSDLSSSEFELNTTTKSWISLSPLGQVRSTNYFNAVEFFDYYPDNSCSTSTLPAASDLSPYQVSKLPF